MVPACLSGVRGRLSLETQQTKRFMSFNNQRNHHTNKQVGPDGAVLIVKDQKGLFPCPFCKIAYKLPKSCRCVFWGYIYVYL